MTRGSAMRGPARIVAIALLLIAVLVGSTWYSIAGTPEYSLYRLSHAIQARDVNAAERYLDVESVAKDVAEASVEYFRSSAGQVAPTSGPWGQLGQAFAESLIELMLPGLKAKIENGVKETLRKSIAEGQTDNKLFAIPNTVSDLRSKLRVDRSGSAATATIYDGSKVVSKFKMAQQSNRTWKIAALDRQWFLSYLRESSPPVSPTLEGKTLAAIIEEQRKIAAETLVREAETKARKGEQEREEALIAEMVHYLSVTVYDKGFVESDVSAGRYGNYITIKVAMQNRGEKAIRAFRGTLIFKDLFGSEIYSSGLSHDEGLKLGERKTQGYEIEYNQFFREHKQLRNTALSNIRVEWKPKTILFYDGTKLGE
jgi:hypothetical protein